MKLKLLSSGKANTKLGKNGIDKIDIYSLNLRPYKTIIDGKSFNVCPFANSCAKNCVGDNGHFGMKNGSAYKAQLRKTEQYFRDPKQFYKDLYNDITVANNKAKKKGNKLVLRLNAYSDINHYKQSLRYMKKDIYSTFNDVIFYDYSKDYKKAINNDILNYSVSFSYDEVTTDKQFFEIVNAGKSISVVFEKLPKTYKGIKVTNGDLDDNRFLDEKNTVTGLKFKGSKAKLFQAIANGFCIPSLSNQLTY
tara:strand:- start:46 stop:795 length:750 start_codon:yes stop_codon:yes gene_type:complete